MSIKLQLPKLTDLKPRMTVIGIGGAGCNAINNMIAAGLTGVDFVVANTDAQSLAASSAEHRLQLGVNLTEGLGAGARPEIGEAAAEEVIDDIRAQVSGSHMVFIAAGMGGGTGTGAASVIARVAKEMGILTVAVVTKPFHFEGTRRMRIAEAGIQQLRSAVDTMIVIPNQNLFRIANEKTTFAEAFILADQVLYSGVACIVDLIIKEGLINLDFADVRAVMAGMGTAMMGTGEAEGENRATLAAEEAISNPLLDEISLKGARGLLLSITGGNDLTLYEVDEAASRVREEVDAEANIIVGATFDDSLGEAVRVSIVASGLLGEEIAEQNGEAWPNAQPVGAHFVPRTAQENGSDVAPPPHLSPLLSGDGYTARFDDEVAAGSAGRAGGAASADQGGGHGPMGKRQASTGDLQFPAGANVASEHNVQVAPPVPSSGQQQTDARHWHAPGDVVIEEGVDPLGGDEAYSGLTDGRSQQDGDDTRAPSYPGQSFQPAAPVRAPRGSRRIPELDEFPDVGQRDYRAKKSDSAASPPAGARRTDQGAGAAGGRPAQQSRGANKPSLFQRLTSLGKRDRDSQAVGRETRERRAKTGYKG